MRYNRISPRALLLWELAALIIAAVPIVILSLFFPAFSLWWNVTVLPVAGIYLLAAVFYLPLLYKSTRYALDARRVLYEKGIFFHRKHFMNRERIVFVTVAKTPLTPLFGVSSLLISATGAKIRIPFLDTSSACRLARELSPEIDLS